MRRAVIAAGVNGETYETVGCHACRQAHLVTGKVLGAGPQSPRTGRPTATFGTFVTAVFLILLAGESGGGRQPLYSVCPACIRSFASERTPMVRSQSRLRAGSPMPKRLGRLLKAGSTAVSAMRHTIIARNAGGSATMRASYIA
jgi:hypothetical protein